MIGGRENIDLLGLDHMGGFDVMDKDTLVNVSGELFPALVTLDRLGCGRSGEEWWSD